VARRIGTSFQVNVVGGTFTSDYPESYYDLEQEIYLAERLEGPGREHLVRYPSVRLERNPDNPHDPNAIEVWMGLVKLGHVPADKAKHLAPLMDAGQDWRANAVKVRISDDNPDNPGLDIRIKRKSRTRRITRSTT